MAQTTNFYQMAPPGQVPVWLQTPIGTMAEPHKEESPLRPQGPQYTQEQMNAVKPVQTANVVDAAQNGNAVQNAAKAANAPAATPSDAAQNAVAPAPSTPAQSSNLVDFADRANKGYAAADAMQASVDAARQANEAAQAQQLASYDATPFRPLGFYEQLQKTLNPYKPPTAAEIQRQLKRERGQKVIAAVGDAIAAMSNMWGTSRGALNAYDGKNTLSQRYADMYEKLRLERKADQEKYYQTYLQALGLDDANANAQRANAIAKAGVGAQNARYNYAALQDVLDKMRGRADQYAIHAQQQANTDRAFNEQVRQYDQNFKENQRQFDVNKDLQKQQLAISAGHLAIAKQQAAQQLAEKSTRLVVGDKVVDLPTAYLHSGNLQKLYSYVRNSCMASKAYGPAFEAAENKLRKGNTTSYGGVELPGTGKQPLTDADKLALVQQYLPISPKAQDYVMTLKTGKAVNTAQSAANVGHSGSSGGNNHKSDPYGSQKSSGSHKDNPYG